MRLMKYALLQDRNIVIVGFGSIGPPALYLIFKHIDIRPEQIEIISDNDINRLVAENQGIRFTHFKLTPENYNNILSKCLRKNDILLNLAMGVCSLDLIALCQRQEALYLDTSNEIWMSQMLNTYERREKFLKAKYFYKQGPTALICHGANPGLVTHFAKKAILEVARSMQGEITVPCQQDEWGKLAEENNVIALHIAEQDTQRSAKKHLENEYVNTWSIDGFLEEATENVGFAWGSHEMDPPEDQGLIKTSLNTHKCRVIELKKMGAETQIKSWAPNAGTFEGFLIPHPEAYSIAELFRREHADFTYHPTVHFVYQPCQDALSSMHEAIIRGQVNIKNKRLLINEIFEGMDELGILVIRRSTSEMYWFGSQLDIHDVRQILPDINATSLQVAAGIISGLIWVINNPRRGLVEPEEIDFEQTLKIAAPYLGKLEGHWAKWSENHYPKTIGEILRQQFNY